MDQEKQQNVNQAPFDGQQFQTNHHQAQFQQHLNQYEQPQPQQQATVEFEQTYQTQTPSGDQIMQVQYQSQVHVEKQESSNSAHSPFQNTQPSPNVVQKTVAGVYYQQNNYPPHQEAEEGHSKSLQQEITQVQGGNQQVIQQQQHQETQQYSDGNSAQLFVGQQFMQSASPAIDIEQSMQNQPLSLNETPSFRPDFQNQFTQQQQAAQSTVYQQIPQQIPSQQEQKTDQNALAQLYSQVNQQKSDNSPRPDSPSVKHNQQNPKSPQYQQSKQHASAPHHLSPQLQGDQPVAQSHSQHRPHENGNGGVEHHQKPVQQDTQQINQSQNYHQQNPTTVNQVSQNTQQQQQQQFQQNSTQINTSSSQSQMPNRSQAQQQQPGFVRPPPLGGMGGPPNFQLQNIVNNIISLVKKGDIDQVVTEINRSGVDPSQLNDSANFNQHLIFSTTLIPDDGQATRMGEVLKKLGVNPGQVDTLSQTPLYYACREGKNQLCEFLIENGCNVNHIDTYGQNPIFYACREGRIETIKKLVQHNTQTDLIDNNGQTPLFYAVKHGKAEVVEYLIQNGANVNITDKKGITPTTLAKRSNKGQILDILVKYGAAPLIDPNQKNKGGKKQPPPPQPPKQKVNERKNPAKYQLTMLKDGVYQPVTEEELEILKREHPDIARYFDLPEESNVIEELPIPEVSETAPIYDSWDKAAKRLVNTLWKHQNSWIFHEPVDPIKLNIPDYYDIIKNPMDLSQVKTKLNNNEYTKINDFLYDVQLIFDNCLLYNGDSTQVSQMCKSVRDEFQKQYHILNLDFYV